MSGLLSGPQEHQVHFLLGPWLIGSCIDLLLQGVLCSQFVTYFTCYPVDHRRLKIVVAILALLTVLKSVQAFPTHFLSNRLQFFGDIQGALLLSYTSWWESGNPLMVAAIGFYVQCYFCFRLWGITRKWYVVAPIFMVFVFGLLSIIVATYFISTTNLPQITNWFAAHLSSVFAGDITLCLTTAFFLIKSKKDVLPQTVGLINSLVRLTFQTAAPRCILYHQSAMFNLVFSQMYTSSKAALVSTAFNMALPKLYAVSMMWTLNARHTIRAMNSGSDGNGMMTVSVEPLSDARSRAQRRTNVDIELGAIQMLTQTEQHSDVRDIFAPTRQGKLGLSRDYVGTKESDDGSSVQCSGY
ncbi:hypothetical protein MVEN_01095900 [Mycena venus]|uniref:DUF6534 domain-containing protein n=1 Tax=Mycena venus TaxID=2733690 RepID=A0A8H7CXM5_9AGAR|nr:hypothetical protein MVEN_01095900 [Mycena venus]